MLAFSSRHVFRTASPNGTKCFRSYYDFFTSKPNISVLNLHGAITAPTKKRNPLGGTNELNLESLRKTLDKAFKPKKLAAVFLSINCPGGYPVQTELLAEAIDARARAKNVPVITFVEDIAASGGYWLATAGDPIVVSPCSIVGSIGVIMTTFGLDEFIAKHDVRRRVYTAGESKNFMDPFLPVKAEDEELIHGLMDDVHVQFKTRVRRSRGNRLKDEDDLFSGKIWVGQRAVDVGLADLVGNVESYVRKEFGGLEKVNMKRIKSPKWNFN